MFSYNKTNFELKFKHFLYISKFQTLAVDASFLVVGVATKVDSLLQTINHKVIPSFFTQKVRK